MQGIGGGGDRLGGYMVFVCLKIATSVGSYLQGEYFFFGVGGFCLGFLCWSLLGFKANEKSRAHYYQS